MPLRIDQPEQEHIDTPEHPPVRLIVRTPADSNFDLEVLRARLDPALEPWLKDRTVYPLRLEPGQEGQLLFAVQPGLGETVAGEIDLYIAEAGFTAIRTVRLGLWPSRSFDGIFAIDFGASRIAAAYIDPATGSDLPCMVEFADGQCVSTTFAADFAHAPPRGRDLATLFQGDQSLLKNVFFRPRQFLAGSDSRLVVLSKGQDQHLEASSAAWLLAHVLRQAAKYQPGQPRRVTVPMSASLTPSQVARFEGLIQGTDGLRGRVNPVRVPPLVLDEATAVAFAWIRENEQEVSRVVAAGQGGALRLLVLDAGASSVELSLLELKLEAFPSGRLKVTPRQLAKDACRWLAGDRVTALLFPHLKRRVASRLDPDLGDNPDDRQADRVLPTRFAGQFGPEYALRFRNFWALWHAAEELKKALGGPGERVSVRVQGLEPAVKGLPRDVTVELHRATLERLWQPELAWCRERLDQLICRDEMGQRWSLDYILWTGAAGQLPAFREGLLLPFLRDQNDFHGLLCEEPGAPAVPAVPAHGRPGRGIRLINWTDEGKKAVAKGAALAEYYRDYAAATARDDGSSRLVFLMEEFCRWVPFSLLYASGGYLRRLLPPGSTFPEANGQLQPLRCQVNWQPKLPFYRCAGGGPLPLSEEGAEKFAQYLGQVELPPPGDNGAEDVVVELLPNHCLQVRVAGSPSHPVETASRPRDRLDDPFSGEL